MGIYKEAPKVKAKLINGFDRVDGQLIGGVYIIVQNPSPHTLYISNILILYPYKENSIKNSLGHIWKFRRLSRHICWVHTSLSNYDLNAGCPFRLEPGKSYSVFIPDAILRIIFKDAVRNEIMCVVQDEVRKPRYSQILKYEK